MRSVAEAEERAAVDRQVEPGAVARRHRRSPRYVPSWRPGSLRHATSASERALGAAPGRLAKRLADLAATSCRARRRFPAAAVLAGAPFRPLVQFDPAARWCAVPVARAMLQHGQPVRVARAARS